MKFPRNGRGVTGWAVLLVFALSGVLATSPLAHAEPEEMAYGEEDGAAVRERDALPYDGPGYGTKRTVIDKSVSRNQLSSSPFASCQALSEGSTCTITSGKTTNREIGLSLGAGRGEVSASLGISSSTSVTVTVGCESGKMKKGQVFRAYAKGDRYSYRIQAVTSASGVPIKKETSPWLTAFDPYPAHIACK